MSFALAILENVLRIAEERNARIVRKIRVEVGELLMINPEQLEFCFKSISKETIAENADLEIEVAKAEITCSKCGDELGSPYTLCGCGGHARVNGGKDMVLKSISLEVDNAQG